MVTESPTLSASLVQPALRRSSGLAHSTAQLTVLAARVLHVDIKQRVRIVPLESGDDSAQGHRLLLIEFRAKLVVRQKRQRGSQRTACQGKAEKLRSIAFLP